MGRKRGTLGLEATTARITITATNRLKALDDLTLSYKIIK
jgi:hypothetical protein